MAYNDDPEYYDDDDVEYYDDDDESYVDYSEDDDADSSPRSSVRGSIAPFSTGGSRSGLPGSSSRFGGSASGGNRTSRSDLRDRLTSATEDSGSRSSGSRFGNRSSSSSDDSDSGSTSRFGGSSSSRFSGGSSSSRFSSRSSSSDSDDSSSGDSGSSSRFGGSSSSRFSGGSGSSRFSSRSSSSDSDDSSNRFSSRSSSDDKASDDSGSSSRFGGSSSSRFGNRSNASSSGSSPSRFSSRSSSSDSDDSSSGDSGSSNRFGGSSSSRFGNRSSSGSSGSSSSRFSSRSGSGDKASDDKSSSGSGSSSSRFGNRSSSKSTNSGGSKSDKEAKSGTRSSRTSSSKDNKSSSKAKQADKKAAAKPDENQGGLAGRFNSLRSALPTSGGDVTGGLAGRLGNLLPTGGGDGDAKGKADKTGGGGGLGGRFSNLRSALPIGGDSTESKDSKATAKGKASKASSSTTKKDPKSTRQSPLGKARAANKDDKSSKKGATTAAATASASPLAGITSSLGGLFGNRDAGTRQSKSRSKAPSKVPTTTEDGLTLDNWLDILGVFCVFSSLVLFFSAISAEQAIISVVHNALGELFGWGAAAAPIALFIFGTWLIVRHFGEEAPTVDPVRVIGVAISFISLLVIFQYIDSFNVERYGTTQNYEQLRVQLRLSWDYFQAGGGVIGAEIYYFLLTTVTEVGGFLLIIFTMLVGMMLTLRLSASEIALFFIGAWRNLRDGMSQRAVERRAKRKLAAQKAAEIAAQRAQERSATQQVAEPATEPMPETVPQAVPAVAAATASGGDAGIRFNFGGQAQAAPANQQVVAMPTPQVQPAPQPNGNGGGGLFSRFRSNSGTSYNQPQPPPLVNPLPLDDGTILPPGQAEQPAGLPGLPAKPAATTASTPSLGELMRGNTTEPAPEEITPVPPAINEAATSEPEVSQAQATPEMDPAQARIERLNALRRGEIGELSQSALARARKEDLENAFVPQSEGKREEQYSAFGKPDDLVTHPSENIPFARDEQTSLRPSQLPSVQPDGDSGPRQQPLSVPVSSPVQPQGRARADWRLPDYRTLLSAGGEQEFDRELLLKQAKTIEDTLAGFGAPGRVVEVNTGPVVTQFGVEPDYLTSRSGRKQRVKVAAIAALDRDLQLALGARSIRVEAPVPGKGYVGIEIPNAEPSLVGLRDVMESAGFQKVKSPLAISLGQSVSGAPVSADLASMPHVLIAGTTGSGKSVCVNSIIASILSRNTPDQVKFIMVDPKRVELTGYNGIPHLVAPVVVELERIVGVLKWVTREMDERYKKFSEAGARNIEDFNSHIDPAVEAPMPYIVVIIDELADLMMLAPEETERTIARMAALARATGIHLVIATQRPSVDVVTGLIKANFPARIAFAVAGSVDSRVILDQPGAERLLGKGDMLYLSGSSPAPVRMQGVFVSDMEISNLVRYWKMHALQQPSGSVDNLTTKPRFSQSDSSPPPMREMPGRREARQQAFWDSDEPMPSFATGSSATTADAQDVELSQGELTGDVKDGSEDELYEKAVELVRRLDKASISLLQRRLRIGYTRAARLIDVMEARGVVGPAKEGSSKPRDVLPT